jgi:hypothetical protein
MIRKGRGNIVETDLAEEDESILGEEEIVMRLRPPEIVQATATDMLNEVEVGERRSVMTEGREELIETIEGTVVSEVIDVGVKINAMRLNLNG